MSVFRKVYDKVTKQPNVFGVKAPKAVNYSNLAYAIRQEWRKHGKSLFSHSKPAVTPVNSAGSLYGSTGSIVGRY